MRKTPPQRLVGPRGIVFTNTKLETTTGRSGGTWACGSDAHDEFAGADSRARLPLASDQRQGLITTAFPQKRAMILRRTPPPLLETPFEAFDNSVFTPNDRSTCVGIWADIPTTIDATVSAFKSAGTSKHTLALTLKEIINKLPRMELVAVNQCSGNSRSYFEPRVAGGQWSNGAMGNARWTGVRTERCSGPRRRQARCRPGAFQRPGWPRCSGWTEIHEVA